MCYNDVDSFDAALSDGSNQHVMTEESLDANITLSDLSSELCHEFIQYLSDDEILNFAMVSRQTLQFTSNRNLWIKMIIRVFGKNFMSFETLNDTMLIDLKEVYFALREFFCHEIEETIVPWPLHTKFRVIDAHIPSGGRSDEIELKIGDIVRVHDCYIPPIYKTQKRCRLRALQTCLLANESGVNPFIPLANAHSFLCYFLPCDRRWCTGVNLNSGEGGSFRFSCLRMIEGSGGPSTVYEGPEFIWPGEVFLMRFISHSFVFLSQNQQQKYSAAYSESQIVQQWSLQTINTTPIPSDPWLLLSPTATNVTINENRVVEIDFPKVLDDSVGISRRQSISSIFTSQAESKYLTPSRCFDSINSLPNEIPMFEPLVESQVPTTKYLGGFFSSEDTIVNNDGFETDSPDVLPPLSFESESSAATSRSTSYITLGSLSNFHTSPTMDPFPSFHDGSSMFPDGISELKSNIVGRKLAVLRTYEPQRADEIALRDGDFVKIRKYWEEDDWCEGVNISLGTVVLVVFI
ncbi:hypothetical protein HK096_004288, partial [Nowakowskiella sp. JEL0078]